jgi:hypothetical protein
VEDSARYLQDLVERNGYPGGTIHDQKPFEKADGECLLFVDGLRLDTSKRLAEILVGKGFLVDERPRWAALPSVTSTGKPADTPVRDQIRGEQANVDFEPCVAETGQSLKGGYHLRKLLANLGWDVLEKTDTGHGSGNAWAEFGDIDGEGHDRGWKLSKHLDRMLREVGEHVEQLFASGWKRVRIVTDHGWLLMPGHLPKTDLPTALTETKWPRCAALKSGAASDERLFPWYWNPDHQFALANGISCYREGVEYAHGGLSLQECLTLELIVHQPATARSRQQVEVTDVVWKGLRCTVIAAGDFSALSVDIRTQPGNSSTSVVVSVKAFKESGTASVIVENEELEGSRATVVLLGQDEEVVAQIETVIGGVGT